MSTSPGPHAHRYPNFDILRLLLAVQVVAGHVYGFTHPGQGDKPWPIAAVPSFLGISGFLVLRSMERSPSYLNFAWRRVCRVAPAFLASLALCGIIFGSGFILASLHVWASMGFFHLYSGSNGPMWSLSAEEIASALMAALFALGAYRTPKVAVGIIAIALPILVLTDPPMQALLIPAFFAGSLCYIARDTLNKLPAWSWFALLGLVIAWRAADPELLLPVSTALSAFAIVGIGAWGPKLQPESMPDLSYGLYIYHYPLILWAMSEGLPAWVGAVAALPIAVASWYGIEVHALKLKSWHPSRRELRPVQP